MNDVSRWFQSGAEVREGLRLLSIYAPNRHVDALVRAQPQKFSGLLKKLLMRFADSPPVEIEPVRKYPRFREQWNFLSEDDCPMELKILAADKITAYHNYVRAHEELFQCATLESCFETAKKVIKNFSVNRLIVAELAYYKEHRRCLGKHPIFSEAKRLAELRALPISELFRKRRNLEGAIWRINNEIQKGTKPHLLIDRENRRHSKQKELEEINRMIEDYEKRK